MREPTQGIWGVGWSLFTRKDWAVFLRGDPAQSDCLSNKYGNAFGLHLVHDLDAVALDRALTNVEPQRNGLAGKAFNHKIHDLRFSGREPSHAGPQLLDGSLARKRI